MDNLFEGLEEFGMGTVSKNVNIFEEEERENKPVGAHKAAAVKKIPQEDTFIFDKTFTCPICNTQFKSKIVKVGKPRFLGSDTDLRPIYEGIDAIKYEAVVCLHCGYAATVRNFNEVTDFQSKEIKEKITPSFKGMTNEVGVYSYKYAVDRMKMVLLNDVIKHAKVSERAHVCLKLAWLYRGMAESIDKILPGYRKEIVRYNEEEEKFLRNAYDGFTKAIQKELPPICNMDNLTLNYLLAELGRRCHDYSTALKYVTYILESRGASVKIKEKAREVRDRIKSDMDKKE